MRTVSPSPAGGRPRFGTRRTRIIALLVAGGLLALLLSLRGIARFYTDYLWFDSLDRTDVWGRVLLAKVALFVIFAVAFFILIWINLMIVERLAPKVRPPGPEEELLSRYHSMVSGRTRLVRLAVSVLFSLLAASGVSNQWEEWLLFVNRKDFGVVDPLFDTDIGFYVFRLPFLTFLVNWLFAAFMIILVVIGIAHYINGGIRGQVPRGAPRVLPSVKVHLSAILAGLALVKAADYWLSRYELTVSDRGVVDGALYTDVKAKLPAFNLLLLISLFAVVLLVVNLRRRGWVLPALAVGLWAFTALVMGNMYPAFVQRFQVDPNTTARESVYTDDNIAATRAAYSLVPDRDVAFEVFDYRENPTPAQLRAAAQTVRNARILDPLTLTDTFEKDQGERDFYRFSSVLDVDRYEVDGELTQVVLAARELNLSELASWERQHVAITHGYGMAIARANVTDVRGSPVFITGGLPVEVDEAIDLQLDQPQIYVGENLEGYALVGATRDEVDYVDGQGREESFRYTGEGGVNMGSFLRQTAFALRFGQLDPLISNFVSGDTSIIYIRDAQDRVKNIAPFLEFDSDAYPVIFDGRIHYVLDAYTTTDRYPYSQTADASGLEIGAELADSSVNYIRNSVKAVVDSYDGDVTLYVMPVADPIVAAWQGAFPDLFTDFSEMPDGLRTHLRFPTDLFTVQTNMWASYQVSDPEALIIGTERWAVAQDPGRSVLAGGTAEAVVGERGLLTSRERRVPAYYSLIQLPGEDDASFVALRSFVPTSDDDSRKELTAFMVGETRADGTSRLVSYEMSNLLAPGPAIVASNISTNPDISRELTLLNDQGSLVDFGDMLLLPVDDSVLYVRPMYVRAQGTQIPLLAGVIASVGNRTALGKTLGQALSDLYPGTDFEGVVLPPIVTDGDVPLLDDTGRDEPAGDGTDPSGTDTPAVDLGELTSSETQQLIEELAELRRRQDEILARLLEQLEN
ncbi:MAG: UPF0182 family protein [Acidimicrobiaceae bacterium]|nr:UPF0182 family protein [Acidimicrobiaceae bacterium]